MDADFVDSILNAIWTQPGATHVFVTAEDEDRPVLDTVGVHAGDFRVEPRLDLRLVERAANRRSHFGIAPKRVRQREDRSPAKDGNRDVPSS
jgi:hypothetical protein